MRVADERSATPTKDDAGYKTSFAVAAASQAELPSWAVRHHRSLLTILGINIYVKPKCTTVKVTAQLIAQLV